MMASANRKTTTKKKAPEKNVAGRVNKQPPTKAAIASSSRQKKAGSSKAAQKPAQAVVEKLSRTGNKRKAAEAVEQEQEQDERPDVAKMPMLKARVRHIPQNVVESKWAPLLEKGREEILDVVKAAERPVLMTFRKEKQRVEAQEGLRVVMRKLQIALPKIPVPPMGKDASLNYEKLTEKNRELESVLEPDLRQIAELEAEIEREQRRLEQDKAYYEKLKKNAVSQENIRRQKTRSMHPLLRNISEATGGVKDGVDDINLASTKFPAIASSYDVNSDRQILPLTKALQQHLSSMQGNSGPLEEVAEWIQRSRAAVDEVLFERVGVKAYDRIIGL